MLTELITTALLTIAAAACLDRISRRDRSQRCLSTIREEDHD